ncbi:MAG TPA: sugar phosphate nucleotidyltransferase, partial [Kribbellaceae bacterium]|nr:sugar phosphate nucleotidyltransferase [Kribbellaceae bacterium]
RPVIHYLVDECVNAGASDIAIVIPPGLPGEQVVRYFDQDVLQEVLPRLTFIEQPTDGRYGTAIPVLLAQPFINNDYFFLLNADDLMLRFDGGSDLAGMLASQQQSGTEATVGAAIMPGRRARRYGVLLTARRARGRVLAGLRDKPGTLPRGRYRVSVGRMLLPPKFAVHLAGLTANHETGEYQITDALVTFVEHTDVGVVTLAGRYHDCGEVDGWLAANLRMARHRPDRSTTGSHHAGS